jgi:uncharacterized coiled-coil protein SlyX
MDRDPELAARITELENLAVKQQSSIEAILRVVQLQQSSIHSLIDATATNTASLRLLAGVNGIQAS